MSEQTATPDVFLTVRIADYRRTRDAYFAAAERADAAFTRWFQKRQDGEPTNAAGATRLANRLNELSADLAGAELNLYLADLDPRDIDREDNIDREDYSL